jgi:hypothetical protein
LKKPFISSKTEELPRKELLSYILERQYWYVSFKPFTSFYFRACIDDFQASVKTKPKYDLDANATYVIAGGLGGLGRSFARWMASRGARNLLLLSRSGAASAAAKSLVNELEQQGVLVSTPEIDISNGPKLDQLLKGLAKSMPPIKGCIQATAALRVRCFYANIF